MNLEHIEKLVQLAIGVLCAVALVYFIYLELLNPNLTLSDRAFWTLVILAGSGLALKDIQNYVGRIAGSAAQNQPRERDRPHRRGRDYDRESESDDRSE